MEFSKTVATLPDKECPGLKPAETELCVTRPSCEGATQEMMADQVQITVLPIKAGKPRLRSRRDIFGF